MDKIKALNTKVMAKDFGRVGLGTLAIAAGAFLWGKFLYGRGVRGCQRWMCETFPDEYESMTEKVADMLEHKDWACGNAGSFLFVFRRNGSGYYGGDTIMTYKQIEASRELRLWIGQVIVPAVTMAVALASIPEVRNAASTKLEQLKWKLKSRSKG